MKKLFAVLLAVAMLLSLGVTAFAAGKITVANAPENVDYAAYKIFDAEVTSENEVVYYLDPASPWASVLVDENSAFNSQFPNLEFMESTTGKYVVVSQTGFNAGDFAKYLKDNVPAGVTPVISQDDPATAGLNNQDNTQVILNLEDGYYLVLQVSPVDEGNLVESAAATDSSFRYVGSEAGATGEIGAGAGQLPAALYESTPYWKYDDEIVPNAYYQTLSTAEQADYSEYHYRKTQITETDFQGLPFAEKANYAPNATAFEFVGGVVTGMTEKAYNALVTDAQRALYEVDENVWYHDTNDPDHDNPIDDATYQAFDDGFKANFVAGVTYKTKTEITSAEYMALATAADNALMANYSAKVTAAAPGGQLVPRPGVTVTPIPEATPALTTVIDGQNVQIQNKDDMPLEKEVEKNGEDVNNQGVSVGDEMNYTITTKVPVRSGDPGETIFTLWDTMSEGLTLKDNQIKITIGDNDATKIEYTITYHEGDGTYEHRSYIVQEKKVGGAVVDAQDFKLSLDPKEPLTGYAIRFAPESEDGYTFELSLPVNSTELRAFAGKPITVEYIGVVNDSAVAEVLKNAASLHFKDDNGEWIKDVETDNYISSIVIDKFETGNRTQKLAGAEFVLWRNAGAADVVSQAELDAAYAAAQQAAYDAVINGYKGAAYEAAYGTAYGAALAGATAGGSTVVISGGKTYAEVYQAAYDAVIAAAKAAYAASAGLNVNALNDDPADPYYDYWHTTALGDAAAAAGTAAADAAAETYAAVQADAAATAAADAAVDANDHPEIIAEANNAKTLVVKNTDAVSVGDKIYYQLTSNGALVPVARYTDDNGIVYDKPLKVDQDGALILDGEGNPQMLENLKVNWTPDIEKATKVVTDANGFAQFAFLPDGTYQLEETKPPIDYTKLLNPIEIEVNGKDALDQSLSQTQRENALTNIAYVENTPGTSLPSTGGVGATLLTIGGVALMLAAGAYLILRRRSEQE